MWSANGKTTPSVGFLCVYRKREVRERVGSLISQGKGVGRSLPPTRPAQFRIANCFCFLGLHAQTPHWGYLCSFSPSLDVEVKGHAKAVLCLLASVIEDTADILQCFLILYLKSIVHYSYPIPYIVYLFSTFYPVAHRFPQSVSW